MANWYSKAGTDNAIQAAINDVLAGAPGALNTLKELADAINDDASYAATVTTALANKAPNLNALPVATTSVAPTVGAIQPYSLGGGAFAPTLPALAGLTSGSTYVGIQKSINDSSSNGVTVTCAGSDTFDSGATSLNITVAGELRILQVVTISGTKRWKVVGGNTPISAIDTKIAAQAVLDAATYSTLLTPASTYTWNPDGTIATQTIGGVTTTFTWNSDGTLATETRAGVTRTYTYSAGILASVA